MASTMESKLDRLMNLNTMSGVKGSNEVESVGGLSKDSSNEIHPDDESLIPDKSSSSNNDAAASSSRSKSKKRKVLKLKKPSIIVIIGRRRRKKKTTKGGGGGGGVGSTNKDFSMTKNNGWTAVTDNGATTPTPRASSTEKSDGSTQTDRGRERREFFDDGDDDAAPSDEESPSSERETVEEEERPLVQDENNVAERASAEADVEPKQPYVQMNTESRDSSLATSCWGSNEEEASTVSSLSQADVPSGNSEENSSNSRDPEHPSDEDTENNFARRNKIDHREIEDAQTVSQSSTESRRQYANDDHFSSTDEEDGDDADDDEDSLSGEAKNLKDHVLNNDSQRDDVGDEKPQTNQHMFTFDGVSTDASSSVNECRNQTSNDMDDENLNGGSNSEENRDSMFHADAFFNPATKNNDDINEDRECEEDGYRSDVSGMWSSLHRMFDEGNELKVKNEKKIVTPKNWSGCRSSAVADFEGGVQDENRDEVGEREQVGTYGVNNERETPKSEREEAPATNMSVNLQWSGVISPMSTFSATSDPYREKDTHLLLWKHKEKQNATNNGSAEAAIMDTEQSQHGMHNSSNSIQIVETTPKFEDAIASFRGNIDAHKGFETKSNSVPSSPRRSFSSLTHRPGMVRSASHSQIFQAQNAYQYSGQPKKDFLPSLHVLPANTNIDKVENACRTPQNESSSVNYPNGQEEVDTRSQQKNDSDLSTDYTKKYLSYSVPSSPCESGYSARRGFSVKERPTNSSYSVPSSPCGSSTLNRWDSNNITASPRRFNRLINNKFHGLSTSHGLNFPNTNVDEVENVCRTSQEESSSSVPSSPRESGYNACQGFNMKERATNSSYSVPSSPCGSSTLNRRDSNNIAASPRRFNRLTNDIDHEYKTDFGNSTDYSRKYSSYSVPSSPYHGKEVPNKLSYSVPSSPYGSSNFEKRDSGNFNRMINDKVLHEKLSSLSVPSSPYEPSSSKTNQWSNRDSSHFSFNECSNSSNVANQSHTPPLSLYIPVSTPSSQSSRSFGSGTIPTPSYQRSMCHGEQMTKSVPHNQKTGKSPRIAALSQFFQDQVVHDGPSDSNDENTANIDESESSKSNSWFAPILQQRSKIAISGESSDQARQGNQVTQLLLPHQQTLMRSVNHPVEKPGSSSKNDNLFSNFPIDSINATKHEHNSTNGMDPRRTHTEKLQTNYGSQLKIDCNVNPVSYHDTPTQKRIENSYRNTPVSSLMIRRKEAIKPTFDREEEHSLSTEVSNRSNYDVDYKQHSNQKMNVKNPITSSHEQVDPGTTPPPAPAWFSEVLAKRKEITEQPKKNMTEGTRPRVLRTAYGRKSRAKVNSEQMFYNEHESNRAALQSNRRKDFDDLHSLKNSEREDHDYEEYSNDMCLYQDVGEWSKESQEKQSTSQHVDDLVNSGELCPQYVHGANYVEKYLPKKINHSMQNNERVDERSNNINCFQPSTSNVTTKNVHNRRSSSMMQVHHDDKNQSNELKEDTTTSASIFSKFGVVLKSVGDDKKEARATSEQGCSKHRYGEARATSKVLASDTMFRKKSISRTIQPKEFRSTGTFVSGNDTISSDTENVEPNYTHENADQTDITKHINHSTQQRSGYHNYKAQSKRTNTNNNLGAAKVPQYQYPSSVRTSWAQQRKSKHNPVEENWETWSSGRKVTVDTDSETNSSQGDLASLPNKDTEKGINPGDENSSRWSKANSKSMYGNVQKNHRLRTNSEQKQQASFYRNNNTYSTSQSKFEGPRSPRTALKKASFRENNQEEYHQTSWKAPNNDRGLRKTPSPSPNTKHHYRSPSTSAVKNIHGSATDVDGVKYHKNTSETCHSRSFGNNKDHFKHSMQDTREDMNLSAADQVESNNRQRARRVVHHNLDEARTQKLTGKTRQSHYGASYQEEEFDQPYRKATSRQNGYDYDVGKNEMNRNRVNPSQSNGNFANSNSFSHDKSNDVSERMGPPDEDIRGPRSPRKNVHQNSFKRKNLEEQFCVPKQRGTNSNSFSHDKSNDVSERIGPPDEDIRGPRSPRKNVHQNSFKRKNLEEQFRVPKQRGTHPFENAYVNEDVGKERSPFISRRHPPNNHVGSSGRSTNKAQGLPLNQTKHSSSYARMRNNDPINPEYPKMDGKQNPSIENYRQCTANGPIRRIYPSGCSKPIMDEAERPRTDYLSRVSNVNNGRRIQSHDINTGEDKTKNIYQNSHGRVPIKNTSSVMRSSPSKHDNYKSSISTTNGKAQWQSREKGVAHHETKYMHQGRHQGSPNDFFQDSRDPEEENPRQQGYDAKSSPWRETSDNFSRPERNMNTLSSPLYGRRITRPGIRLN